MFKLSITKQSGHEFCDARTEIRVFDLENKEVRASTVSVNETQKTINFSSTHRDLNEAMALQQALNYAICILQKVC